MWALLPLTAIGLLFRNLPIGPILAGDEMSYSMMSRQVPYHTDWIPNYIFYLFYSSTNYCGGQFYSCSKILNVAFFLLAGLFVFLTARCFVSTTASALFMLAFFVSPFNVYTTQFMPETMYGALAWMLLYFFVSRESDWRLTNVIVAGAGVAILCMIKPHGVFFGAAYLAAIIFDAGVIGKAGARSVAKKIAVFILSFLAVRLPIGYLFGGKHGLNVLGTSYSAYATMHPFADYVALMSLTTRFALRHVVAVSLIAGVPMCIMLVRSFHASTNATKSSKINTFAALFFAVMIGVTAAFTATVAGTAPGETFFRLHTRYYNFFDFVLYLLLLAEFVRHDEPRVVHKIVAGTSIIILAILSVWYLPTHFQHGSMDNPDIHGLFLGDNWFHLFAAVNIALIALWIFKTRVAAVLFLVVQLPFALILTTNLLTRDIRGLTEYHNAYPKAGDLARTIWGKPLPEYFVAGTGGGGEGFHTAFRLDKNGARIELGPNETLHRNVIPAGVKNGIIVGEHSTDFPYVLVYQDGPIKIIRITEP
jgi:phosphoglycerol transferase